jgi:hypothetical protein
LKLLCSSVGTLQYSPAQNRGGIVPAQSHDFDSWFPRFADNLRRQPLGNPITRLLELDREINPYFVTFSVYWYCVPGLTVADRGKRAGEAALSRLRTIPKQLLEVAEDMRWVLGCKLPSPWGNQLRELIAKEAVLASKAGEMQSLPALCEGAAPLFERWYQILKDQTSGKRNSRAAYGIILWLHLTHKIPVATAGRILESLLDCGGRAFGKPDTMLHWDAVDRSADRYRKRFPQDYERRLGEASRSRGPLSDVELMMWRRLEPIDRLSIIETLRPRFVGEVQRARGKA